MPQFDVLQKKELIEQLLGNQDAVVEMRPRTVLASARCMFWAVVFGGGPLGGEVDFCTSRICKCPNILLTVETTLIARLAKEVIFYFPDLLDV